MNASPDVNRAGARPKNLLHFALVTLVSFLTLFVFQPCLQADEWGGPTVEVTIIGSNAPAGAKGKFHVKQTPSMTELYYFLNTMNAFTGGSERIHILRNQGDDKKTFVLDLLKAQKEGKGKATFKLNDGDIIAIPAY